ncbi:MAG: hypothetical protein FJ109_13000 [Deltaproteobacteria bacterium]|nr:hypothetical protein [Deltaproteobacteria bacterium]
MLQGLRCVSWVLVALVLAACGSDGSGDGADIPGKPWWTKDGQTIPPGDDTADDGTGLAGDAMDDGNGRGGDQTPWKPDVQPGDTQSTPDQAQPKPDTVEPPDCQWPDPCCIPGTQCYKKKWQILASLVVIMVDEMAYNPDYYLLDVLPPQGKTVKFSIRSKGQNQLNLVKAFIEPGGNPFINLVWDTPGMPGSMPMVLMPGEQVDGHLVYQPQGDALGTPSVLNVWSSDPDHLSRTVIFKPKESGPDIELPINWGNWGCGSTCFAHDFTIENAGDKPLVIQSGSFEKPSAEWTVSGFPGPGSTLPPAGSPGYSPFAFQIEYCDKDGNLAGDSNQFFIYSNDPDENPMPILGTVQLPGQCP